MQSPKVLGLSRASARYQARASARTRDRGMLTGRTRLENFSFFKLFVHSSWPS
jgi:hypothetical protein